MAEKLTACAHVVWLCAGVLCGAVLCGGGSALAAGGDSAAACGDGDRWDDAMSMCMPGSGSDNRQWHLQGQFNAFAVFSALQGPRGDDQFAAPNMFMLDAGRLVGAHQFVNLDLMGSTELWTYPRHGYPELLQIGEERRDGTFFVDAQHPHASPVMGLTLSDAMVIHDTLNLRVSFAPRGESTDGPIAFMHRESARDNPDAPLGHHVGQDVGHISSTVLAALLDAGRWTLEGSVFNGTEPRPTVVNMPLGALNSEALRVSYRFSASHRLMASLAHVEQADSEYPGTDAALRLSASLTDHFAESWLGDLDHTLVVGSISRRPGGATLSSILDEAVASQGQMDYWGRLEVVQRLQSELQIALPSSANAANAATASVAPDDRHWVAAMTLGLTRWLRVPAGLQFGTGLSMTVDAVPDAWAAAYGHRFPLTGRLILQVRGAGHYDR
jgi:hypothetical protein